MHATLRTVILAALVALAAWPGCGEDNTSNPAGGGSASFTLPAGYYTVSYQVDRCDGLPGGGGGSCDHVWCRDEAIDAIAGLDCSPTRVSPDTVLVDCSGTEVFFDTCQVDWTMTGTGVRNGDVWTLTVRVEFDDPGGCYGEYDCVDMEYEVQRTGNAPQECAIAGPNTIETVISGGPRTRHLALVGGGRPSTEPGGVSWRVSGEFAGVEMVGLTINLGAIDPADVPRDVFVQVGEGDREDNTVLYREEDDPTDPQARLYRATSGGGVVRVESISEAYIAGSIDLQIEGVTTYGAPPPTQETTPRTIRGSFYMNENVCTPDYLQRPWFYGQGGRSPLQGGNR